MDVMLDLETMGTAPGSTVVAIGAVAVDLPTAVETVDFVTLDFYQTVDLGSCLEDGLTVDAATVKWWLRQSDEARLEVAGATGHLYNVLMDFTEWLVQLAPDKKRRAVWGNGANFDPVLLERAYEAVGLQVPWEFYRVRCLRTLRALYPEVPKVPPVTAHHALEDARAQLYHLVAIERYRRRPGPY